MSKTACVLHISMSLNIDFLQIIGMSGWLLLSLFLQMFSEFDDKFNKRRFQTYSGIEDEYNFNSDYILNSVKVNKNII